MWSLPTALAPLPSNTVDVLTNQQGFFHSQWETVELAALTLEEA